MLPNRAGASQHELGSAVDILSRATSYFELLTQLLQNLESEKDEALSQLEEHERAITTWQELIETAQARTRDAERDLSETRQDAAAYARRADMAEERCRELENALLMQDRRIEEIDSRYKSLHEQVMASFGLESQTYRSLEALVDRFRDMAA